MAGVASIAPAITPFRTSWATSVSTPVPLRYLDQLERAVVHPVETELAVGNVADIGKRAGPTGTRVLDVLALLQRRKPIHSGIHNRRIAVGDLADIVAQRRAGGLARLGDGQRNDADPVGGLRLVRIWRCD